MSVATGLRLRPLREDDLPAVAAWLRDSILEGEYLGATEEMGVEALRLGLEWAEQDERVKLWAIEAEDGSLGGMASWRPDLPWEWVLELELMLAPELRGRGRGLEASRLVIDRLFETTDADKMIVRISALNRRAFPVIRRLGGREEGRLRRHLRIGGEPVDLAICALLREEWEAAR